MRAAILGLMFLLLAPCVGAAGQDEQFGRGPLPLRWSNLSTADLVQRMRSVPFNWRYFDFYLRLPEEVAQRTGAADLLLQSVPTLGGSAATVYEVHLLALAQIEDPRTVEVVAPLLFVADNDVCRQAARTLVQFEPAGVERLLAALPRLRPVPRAAALRALGHTRHPGAGQLLRETLANGAGPERTAACEAVGRRKDRAATPLLLELLQNRGAYLQAAAAAALGELGDPRAVEPLVRLLATDSSPMRSLAEQAAKALGKIGDRRAVQPFVDTLLQTPPYRQATLWTRAAAARSLGQIGDPRAVAALLKALESKLANRPGADDGGGGGGGGAGGGAPGLPILVPAITAALELLAPQALDPVAAALDHSQPQFRNAVAWSLARNPNPRSLALLQKSIPETPGPRDLELLRALMHADPGNARGMQALDDLLAGRKSGAYGGVGAMWAGGGPKAVPFLVRRVPGQAGHLTRLAAALALAKIDDPRGVTAVSALLDDESQNLSSLQDLLHYLTRHDSPQVRGCLLRLARRDTVWGGAYAAEALARVDDQRARPILIAALNHQLGYVPRVAAAGLARLGDAESLAALAGYVREHPAEADWAWLHLYDKQTSQRLLTEILAVVTARQEEKRLQQLLPDLVPALERALSDPREMVRRNAAFLLGQAGMPRSLPKLIELLHDQRAASEAAAALGHIGDPAAVGPLIAYQTRATADPQVASWLAMIGEPAVPSLLEALGRPMPVMTRRRFARALELLPDRRALPLLTPMAEQEEIGVAALAAIADPTSAELLVRMTARRRGVVTREAYAGVVRIGSPAVPALLAELAGSADAPPPLVVLALGMIGDRRAVTPLLACMERQPANTQVLAALGRIGDPAAINRLAGVLSAPELEATARRAAAEALAQIGTAAVRPPLELAVAADRAPPQFKRHIATLLDNVP